MTFPRSRLPSIAGPGEGCCHSLLASLSGPALRIVSAAWGLGIVFGASASAQVVINTPQLTTQNLDTLPNPGNLNTATISAAIVSSTDGVTGAARAWTVTNQSAIVTTNNGIVLNNAGGG